MSGKKDNGSAIGMGDLGMIRDILMGQQMQEIEKRFSALHKDLEKLEASVQTKIEKLDKSSSSSNKELQKAMDFRLSGLEKALKSSIEKLEGKIDAVSDADKQRLGKMMLNFGEKLMKK